MKKVSLLIATVALTVLFSCKNSTKKNDKASSKQDSTMTTKESQSTAPKSQITLTKLDKYPAYKDVTVTLEKPTKTTLQPGKVEFNFDVTNMELGEQTANAGKNGLANSKKGQHIHFILDGEPYMAFYEDDFTKELNEGTHLLVAFASRSYHMSVKNKNAYVARKFTVGNPANDHYKDVDLSTQPTLVYSRPKGTYKGADAKKVLLDFYLLNTTLSPDGNNVIATIDGQEFTLEEWAPYGIEGLTPGEHTVKLELVDNSGKLIPGPLNSVTRTITIK